MRSPLKKIFLCGLLLAGSAYAQRHTTEMPQVILTYDHTENGLTVVVPQGKVAFGLTAFTPKNPAPLTPGSYMICRPFTQSIDVVLKDGTPHNIKEIAFRCGSDVYIFNTLSIVPEK